MAGDDDLERLLREVDASLGEGTARPNAAGGVSARGQVSRRPGGRPAKRDADTPALGRVGQSAVAGGLAAVAVFVAFALLPFLRAGSGAAGAFVGAFAAWLVATLLHRRG